MRELLKEDEYYKKYRRIVKLAQKFPVEAHYNEILGLHNSRSIRGHRGDLSQKDVIKVVMEDQSYRGRIVQIRVETMYIFNTLNSTITAFKGYVLSNYRKYIRGSTVSEREAHLNDLVKLGAAELENLGNLLEVSQEIIDDIDKASYAIKHVIEVKQVNGRGEYSA